MKKQPETKIFSVVMPVDLLEKTRKYAFKNKQKLSESIRILIKKGLSAEDK